MSAALTSRTRALPESPEMQRLIDHLHDYSDREVAILSGGVLDFALLGLILAKLKWIEKKVEYDQLFGERGPAGSTFGKLLLCFHLGLISETMKANVARINKIRNVFAHSIAAIGFETADVANEVKLLTITEHFHIEVPHGERSVKYWLPDATEGSLVFVDSGGRLIVHVAPYADCGVRSYGDLSTGPPIIAPGEKAKALYVRSVKLCIAVLMLRAATFGREPAHFEVAR
jgi:hypothetical protein